MIHIVKLLEMYRYITKPFNTKQETMELRNYTISVCSYNNNKYTMHVHNSLNQPFQTSVMKCGNSLSP